MKKFRLAIDLSDRQLGLAIARAVCREFSFAEVHAGRLPEADFTIEDGFLSGPEPVAETLSRAVAASGLDIKYRRKPGSCRFTLFTSVRGGAGVSSASVAYSRILSCEYGLKVLRLSFDPYLLPSGKSGASALLARTLEGLRAPIEAMCSEDEFRVLEPAQDGAENVFHEMKLEDIAEFLRIAEDDEGVDRVVLDVPRSFRYWKEMVSMCELRVLLVPGDADRAASERASGQMRALAGEEGAGGAGFALFSPAFDPAFRACPRDLYGQYGCEVRELAKRLEC